MKKTFRIACAMLALLLTLTVMPVFARAEQAEQAKTYLLLGDSIAEGYGIANSSEACYGRIVADTLGYDYINYGRAASTSDDLLRKVTQYEYVKDSIKKADLISISIGGNDYLCDDKVVALAFSALLNVNMARFNAITDRFYQNFSAIIDEIKALNPDALIMVQTVYSSWYGLPGIPYGRCTAAVNGCVEKYIENNPGAFEIIDVASAFEGRKDLVADDTIHPNAEGNVEISKLILAKLNELDVTDKTEPLVLADGVDYNYYVSYFNGSKIIGELVTFLIKALTFNLF